MKSVDIIEDVIHDWFIEINDDYRNFLLSNGKINTFLPVAQPWLCFYETSEKAIDVATKFGYPIRKIIPDERKLNS